MKRLRGIAFDLGIALVLVSIVSGPMLWAAATLHVAVKRGLRAVGVL